MKKILLTALIALMVFGVTSTAKAVVLAPGGAVLGLGSASPGGTLVASLSNIPFIGLDAGNVEYFRGTLSQWVRQNVNGLLFEYQITSSVLSRDDINHASNLDFAGFTTDADVAGGANSQITRSFFGTAVTFSPPFGSRGIQPGQTSPLLWIQTNAQYYGVGSTQLQDGGNARIAVYGPTVPEPASMMLLGMGLLGLFGLRKKS